MRDFHLPFDTERTSVGMMMAPRPDARGLHIVVEGTSMSAEPTRGAAETGISRPREDDLISEANFDRTDEQEIDDGTYVRSHSPGATLNRGPYSGIGLGYCMYALLARRATLNRYAGIYSPTGGRSQSAEAMWQRLARMSAAGEAYVTGEPVEDEVRHCEDISDPETERRGKHATITSSRVCGDVNVEIEGEDMEVQFLNEHYIERGGWLLDWPGRGSKLPGARSSPNGWVVNTEALVRIDPGPNATKTDIEQFAWMILAYTTTMTGSSEEGRKARVAFLQRPDIFPRVGSEWDPAQVPFPGFLSGVRRRSGASLGAAPRATPLPPPSAAYKATVKAWPEF